MLVLKNVIMNFPVVLQPTVNFDGGKEKYSMTVLIPKEDTEQLDKIKAAIDTVIAENQSIFGNKKSGIKIPLRDGDEKAEDYKEFEGHMFFNCSTTRRPRIIDMEKNDVIDTNEMVYSGQIINVSVNFFAYNQAGSKGIAAGLNNIQIVGGGTRLFDAAGEEFD